MTALCASSFVELIFVGASALFAVFAIWSGILFIRARKRNFEGTDQQYAVDWLVGGLAIGFGLIASIGGFAVIVSSYL